MYIYTFSFNIDPVCVTEAALLQKVTLHVNVVNEQNSKNKSFLYRQLRCNLSP